MADEVLDNPAPSPAPTESAPAPAAAVADAAPTAQPDWPADWRDKLASGDVNVLKRLERFGAPTDVWRSFRALEQKMSSGEVRANLPENSPPEVIAQWRKDNGIPDSPAGYDIKDLSVNAADKIPESFAKFAHDKNWSPAQLKDALTFRKAEIERISKANQEADAADRQKTEDIYRNEWGQDYRLNTSLVQGLLDATGTSDAMKQDLLETMKLNPDIGKWLVTMARVYNPVATVLPNIGSNVASQVDDRLNELNKLMGNRTSEYWKGQNAEKLQAEWRQLDTAKRRFKQ